MDIIPPLSSKSASSGPPPAPSDPYPPDPRFSDKKGTLRPILSTIGLFVSAFIIAILLNTFVIQSYQVDGQSMEKTLQNDDRLIVDKIPRTWSRITGHQYVPHRGQIIIFNENGLPGFIGQKQLIKRVVGLPGERVVVANGHVMIYNAQHPDGFNPDTAGIYHIDATSTPGSVDQTLGPNQIFVCGDNRANSEDSRYFGPVNTNQVVAKLILRILPLNNAKSF